MGMQVGNITLLIAMDEDDIQLGIAVTGADSTNGDWEYRESGSGNWVPFPGSISTESVLLILHSSWIRFSPAGHFFGTAYLTALAWDMSANVTNSTIAYPSSGPFSNTSFTMTISVTHINDPPVLQPNETEVTYTENGPPVLIFGSSLQISDVDNVNLTSATVILECLSCDSIPGSGSTVLGSGMSLTSSSSSDRILERHVPLNFMTTHSMSGDMRTELLITPLPNSDSSIGAFMRYLQSLYFENTDQEPSGVNRTVTLNVNDGTNTSSPITVTIRIILVNDEVPSVTLPTESITYAENSGMVPIFPSNPIITDLDDNSIFLISEATIILTGADLDYEQLSVNCSSVNPICTFNSSLGVLTIAGNASVATYEQLLGSIMYENSIEEPDSLPQGVTITVFDGLHWSIPVELMLQTWLINDLLPLVFPSPSTVVFMEVNQPPGSPPVVVAPSITIDDPDSGMFPLYSALIELLDPLDNEEGIRLMQQLPIPTTVVVNSSDPFRLSISSSTGQISPLMLEHLLQSVEYFNTAVQPSGNNRTITITVYDQLVTGLTAASPAVITVQFELADDLPEVVLLTEFIMYSEGQELRQVNIAPNASISDADNLEISGLRIELLANSSVVSTSDEILRVNLMGSVVNQTSASNSQLLELRGVAPLDTYTLILRSLTYEHTTVFGSPDSGNRVVVVTPINLDGNMGVSDEVMIAFEAVNNPPVLDLNGNLLPGRNFQTTFREEGSSIYLTSRDLVLSEVDTPGLAFVEITLSPFLDSSFERLTVNTSLAATVTIQQPSLYSIHLQGQPLAPLSEFRDLLLSLTYFNGADEPSSTQRTVTIVAGDGNGTTQASTHVTIELVNDPPRVFLNGTQSNFVTTYTEEGPPTALALSPSIADPDSEIVSLEVRDASAMQFDGDNITAAGLQYNRSLQVYVAVFDPASSSDAVQLLASLTYQSNLLEPQNGTRVFCISVIDDGSLRSQEACSEVNLLFVNDNPPVFEESSYSAQVAENMADTPVTRTTATDADSTNSDMPLLYSIISGDDCLAELTSSGSGDDISTLLPVLPCRFAINNLTGEIFMTDMPPDREMRDNYLLTVAVTDQLFITTVSVNITIMDVVDVAPRFDPLFYNVTVPLGAQQNTTLVQLVVIDPDEGAVTILLDPPDGMGAFAVDGTGRVYLTIPENQLDPSTDQYTLMFTATDDGLLLSETPATVVINIILNSEDPVFDQSPYSSTVIESAIVGTSILTVQATDSDQGSHGEVEYSLDSTEVPFAINTTSGEITLTSNLDYETIQQYVFNVTASDRGRPVRSSSTQVVIDVTNVNEDPPRFTQSEYSIDVCESTPVSYEVLRIAALDSDAGSFGEVAYSVITENCGGCVVVNSSTGAVTLARELNFEGKFTQCRIFVRAQDGSQDISFSDFAYVAISVLNDNEYPPEFAFGTSHTITVPENYPTDSPLPGLQTFQPLATDMDTCDVDQCNGVEIIRNVSCSRASGLQYAIVGGNELGLFAINPINGIITLATSLDFEDVQQRMFTLSLYVTDGELNSTAELQIDVTDFNDNLPVFQNTTYSVQVPETTTIGSVILQVQASDLDPTSQITYSLSGENANHFEINATSGVITVTQALDFETIPAYQLFVTAADRPQMGNASLVVALLNILLTDVNDVIPHFDQSEYSFRVLENISPGAIGTVLAEDEDSGLGSVISYSILTVTPGNPSTFTIDAISGVINTTAIFDREQTDRYSLTVEARDNGEPQLSTTIEVTVIILDENDNTPLFSPAPPVYSVNVTESSEVGTLVLELEASDRDAGSNAILTFTILSGNDRGDFSINSSTGAISIDEQLNRETVASYVFESLSFLSGLNFNSNASNPFRMVRICIQTL